MKIIISYHSIPHDGHIFATPVFTHSEAVEVESEEKLEEYILKQTDAYGGHFKKSKDKFYGYDYISKSGGVKIKKYSRPEAPKFKKI